MAFTDFVVFILETQKSVWTTLSEEGIVRSEFNASIDDLKDSKPSLFVCPSYFNGCVSRIKMAQICEGLNTLKE